MKKTIAAVLVALGFSGGVMAAETHNRYNGAVENFKGTITNKAQFEDLIKYTKPEIQIKLRAAFKDGKLTADEIRASGISDHHFYTGYLASASNQSQYDARLKELNGGKNVDDYLVSNRDLKAHGSMVMNQVEAGNKVQDARTDKIVAGLKELGDHLTNAPTVPTLPDVGTGGNSSYDDTQVKEDISTNADHIQQMGSAFEQHVANTKDAYAGIADAFQAQAQHNAAEVARLDRRIDKVEKKVDKMKGGIASATAIATLVSPTYAGDHSVAVGIGGYDGASAVAMGYTYRFNKNTAAKVAAAIDSENEFSYGASVGMSW